MRYEQWVMRQTSRRRFLQRAGLVTLTVGAGPGLLAACGDDDDDGGGASTTSEGPAKAPAASGRVDFLSWEGYDIPDPLKPWKQANGVTVKGTWSKASETAPTLLFGPDGEPITLTVGQTFVQVIARSYDFSIDDGPPIGAPAP